jgi:NADPH:quinone reductase-like Zn-dependent oxidoreductase|tara:strand:+ start:336 stop:560 length:225 start_codon:yes stop_codon:yes gene_type:complete
MAFKMSGFSAFTKVDPPETQKNIAHRIRQLIENGESNKVIDKEIKKLSDGDHEYEYNRETGQVKVHAKKKQIFE